MPNAISPSSFAPWIAVAIAATQFGACADEFGSCEAQRICATGGTSSGGQSAVGGAGSGARMGSGGSITGGSGDATAGGGAAGDGGSDSDDDGVGGSSGGTDSGNDAGAAGASGAAGSTGSAGDTASGGGDGTGVTCPADQHLCDDRCVPNDDVRTCGASCMPCEAPTGGTATCDGTQCDGECPSAMKLCFGACIAETEACRGECPTGTHECRGLCVNDNDPANCADSCSPCAVPANGSATCDGTACGISCAANYHACNNSSCLPNNSPSSCGTRCTPCPAAPANADATCVQGACGFACKAGYVLSGSNCLPRLEAIPVAAGSTVTGISASGSVVVGNLSADMAYRWEVGSASPSTFAGVALTVSGDGQRVAGCIGSDLAFWSATATPLVIPRDYVVWDLCARASNNDGSVVAGTLYDNDALLDYGFVWSSASSYSYPTGPYDEYQLYGISGNGAVAVGEATIASSTWIPVWWSAQSQLTPLSGGEGQARAISRDGTVIVGWQGDKAVRWSGPGYTTRQVLPDLPSTGIVGAWPYATSQNGSVTVGASSVSDTTREATIWNGGQLQTIRESLVAANVAVTGWNFTTAVAVSDNGKIVVGNGTLNGAARSWIARLP